MISINKGSKEFLFIDVGDRLKALTTLSGTTPTFDIFRKRDNQQIVTNQAAGNIGMTAQCLVDTTPAAFEVGIYNLYLKFASAPEAPRLGPFEFKVDP